MSERPSDIYPSLEDENDFKAKVKEYSAFKLIYEKKDDTQISVKLSDPKMDMEITENILFNENNSKPILTEKMQEGELIVKDNNTMFGSPESDEPGKIVMREWINSETGRHEFEVVKYHSSLPITNPDSTGIKQLTVVDKDEVSPVGESIISYQVYYKLDDFSLERRKRFFFVEKETLDEVSLLSDFVTVAPNPDWVLTKGEANAKYLRRINKKINKSFSCSEDGNVLYKDNSLFPQWNIDNSFENRYHPYKISISSSKTNKIQKVTPVGINEDAANFVAATFLRRYEDNRYKKFSKEKQNLEMNYKGSRSGLENVLKNLSYNKRLY